MTSFARTPTGQINQHHFHTTPIVWVEGNTDIPVYRSALNGIACTIKQTSGRSNSETLIAALKSGDHPYVVVIDGDYDLLTPPGRLHPRVVMLRRYSVENYFVERTVCERVCIDLAADEDGTEYVGNRFDRFVTHVESRLRQLIILDLARHLQGSEEAVLPNRIEPLLEKQASFEVSSQKVKDQLSKTRGKIGRQHRDEAKEQIEQFEQSDRLVNVIRGHLAYGLLRFFLSDCLRSKGKPRTPPDNALTVVLASIIWDPPASDDHAYIKTRLRKAVRNAAKKLAP